MQKDKVIIREAGEKDTKDIVGLLEQVVDYQRKLDKNYKSFSSYENLDKNIASSITRRDTKIFVAESDGEIIGYCEGGIDKAPNYTNFKKMGFIDTLIVDKKHRKKGSGEKLVNALIKWFKEKKINYMELGVDTRNVSGVKFWNSRGFSEYRLKMRKKLK